MTRFQENNEESGKKLFEMLLCFELDKPNLTFANLETRVDLLTGHTLLPKTVKDFEENEKVASFEWNHDKTSIYLRHRVDEELRHCVAMKTTTTRSEVDNLQPARIHVQDEDTGLKCTFLYDLSHN